MPRAIWNGTVIAQSDTCIVVEGNRYFPPQAVNRDFLRESNRRTVCSWKGTARYFDVVVGENVNKDAAWHYPAPKPDAVHVKDYIAFWKGVVVEA